MEKQSGLAEASGCLNGANEAGDGPGGDRRVIAAAVHFSWHDRVAIDQDSACTGPRQAAAKFGAVLIEAIVEEEEEWRSAGASMESPCH